MKLIQAYSHASQYHDFPSQNSFPFNVPAFFYLGNVPLKGDWGKVAPPSANDPAATGMIPIVLNSHPQSDENYATDFGDGLALQPITPAAPAGTTAPILVAPYHDMPPPSYNEYLGKGVALKDDDDNDYVRGGEYKPLYPIYSLNQ